jgi:hypothetical protein
MWLYINKATAKATRAQDATAFGRVCGAGIGEEVEVIGVEIGGKDVVVRALVDEGGEEALERKATLHFPQSGPHNYQSNEPLLYPYIVRDGIFFKKHVFKSAFQLYACE